MNSLDIILMVAMFLGFAIGYFKGLISQLSFGVGIVLGLFQAIIFYKAIGARIESLTGWDSIICSIVAFVSIIVLVLIVVKIIGWLFQILLDAIKLGFIDKILGGIFGCIISMTLIVGAVNASQVLSLKISAFDKTTQENSTLYKYVQEATFSLIGEMKK